MTKNKRSNHTELLNLENRKRKNWMPRFSNTIFFVAILIYWFAVNEFATFAKWKLLFEFLCIFKYFFCIVVAVIILDIVVFETSFSIKWPTTSHSASLFRLIIMFCMGDEDIHSASLSPRFFFLLCCCVNLLFSRYAHIHTRARARMHTCARIPRARNVNGYCCCAKKSMLSSFRKCFKEVSCDFVWIYFGSGSLAITFDRISQKNFFWKP